MIRHSQAAWQGLSIFRADLNSFIAPGGCQNPALFDDGRDVDTLYALSLTILSLLLRRRIFWRFP